MATRGLEYWLLLRDGNFSSGMENAKRKTMGLDGAVNKVLKSTLMLGGGAVALSGIRQYGMEAIQTTAKFEGYYNVLKFASRDMGEFAKNQQFLNDTIREMKLPLQESYEGYSKLLSAMKNTPLESQARNIFKGVMTASTVLHLDSYRQGLVMFALQQMVSKGTVSSEELKRQLGESLPGAMNIAADAMGMSLEKFNKALEKGDIQAIDFLPKFADKLQEHFGKSLPEAINSMQAKLTEAQNKKLELKQELGVTIGPEYLQYLELQNSALASIQQIVYWSKENKAVLKTIVAIGGTYLTLQISILTYKRLHKALDQQMLTLGWLRLRREYAIAAVQKAQLLNLGRMRSLLAGVKAAGLFMGPAGWITAGITAGVGALALFYNKWQETQAKMAEDLKKPMSWGEYFKFQGLDPALKKLNFELKQGSAKNTPIGAALSDNTLPNQRIITGQMTAYQLQQDRVQKFREMVKKASSTKELERLFSVPFSINKSNIQDVLNQINERFGDVTWKNNKMSKSPIVTLEQFGFKKGKDGEIISAPNKNNNVSGTTISESVGAGRQVRNVTVTINGGLVHELNVSTTHLQESADQIERKMKEILIRAIRDSEIAL